MDKLIQMGKELGYEGQALQEFVKQQQDIERSERLAERELEKERIAAEKDNFAQVEKDREVELARDAAENDKIAQAYTYNKSKPILFASKKVFQRVTRCPAKQSKLNK